MFKKYAGSLVAIAIKIAGSLAINKLFAIYFGGAGITLLAHLQNLLGMATLVPTEGIQKGMTKYLSDDTLNTEEKKQFLGAGLFWILGIFVCVCLIISRFSGFFLDTFLGERHPIIRYILFLTALFGQLLYLTGITLLLILQKVKEYVMVSLYATMLAVLAVSLTVSTENIRIALLAFAIGQAVPLIAVLTMFFRIRNQIPDWLKGNISFSLDSFRQLGGFALMALSVLIFGKVVDFYVRQWAINEFGLEAVGLWQALVKVSKSYEQLFTAILAAAFFPKLSSIIHDKNATKAFMEKTFALWIPIISAGLLMVYFLRKWILILLFDSSFVSAGELAIPQLIGDFFYFSGHFLAYWLLAEARLIYYTVLQFVSSVIYMACIYLLLPHFGITAFPVAYAIDTFLCGIVLLVTFYVTISNKNSLLKG